MKKVFGVLLKGLVGTVKALSKLISVKTLIIIVLIAVIIGLILFGRGIGIGKGSGDGEGDGNSVIETRAETAPETESNIVVEEKVEVTPVEQETEKTDTVEGAIVQINVVEREYYYKNERITLDEFIKTVKKIEGKLVVEIKDDNASLKAYNDLLERLDEENINYVEINE